MERFGILGELKLPNHSRPLAGPKVRTVFAALLLNANKPLGIHCLIDELWEDSPPATAAATVRTHVYHLRRTLGDNPLSGHGRMIVTSKAGYELRLPEDRIDAIAFLRLADRGQRLLDQGHVVCAASVLGDALSLWRGDALSDVQCGPMLRRHVVRLEETRINTVQLRIEAELRLGHIRRLIPELKSLVTAHPLNEWLHARYAEALCLSGRRGEALQALGELRKILKEELGLDLPPEIQRVQQRILRGLGVRPDDPVLNQQQPAG